MQYSFGAYRFDPARYALTHAGTPVPLRPQACELLAYLLRHRDRVVPKEELLAQVWPGQYVGDGVLHACVLAVRTALHDTGRTPALLHTVRGRGYRFVAPVEIGDLPLDAPPQGRQPLRSAPAPLADVPLPSSAGSETPAAVAVAAEPHTAGEYKQVSVLCCGLAEAPALAARLGPEGLYHRMQTVVGLAQEVLHLYAGTLLPPTSEGLMAVFGAPVAQEDHARRAVVAALALQQRLRQDPVLRAPLAGTDLAVRMGVHSGLVVLGELEQDAQRRATVVGAPVQVAQRVQAQAAPGMLLLSAATYHLVHAEVRVAPYGTLAVEGEPMPLPRTRCRGSWGATPGSRGGDCGSAAPLWGGHGSWRCCTIAGRRCGRARGRWSAWSDRRGWARRGCSRNLGAVWRQTRCRGIAGTVWRTARPSRISRCVTSCGSSARSWRGTMPQRIRLPIQHRLHACGISAAEDVALVGQILDLPVAPELLAQLSPEARRARTFALLGHLIRQEAQQRPLVLAVEDVHWIDPTSEAWLGSLVERLAGTAVLLLVTARPGYQPPWGTHARVTQLALPPLRAEESQAIVVTVPGTAQLPAARCQQIVAHGAGNPFFVEELAWHAVEDDLAAMPVPATVHAVLAARLDRLPPEAKRLVQHAAVIGTEVPGRLLQRIAGLAEDALHRGLAHLQDTEVLYEMRLFPDPVYTFTHALTHEVAYGSLLLERRRVLHAHIVEAMEALAEDQVANVASGAKALPAGRQDPDQIERLAHHALRGEVWDKAVTYCQQAGARAFDRAAFREAVAAFEQALQSLAHLPEHGDTRGLALELHLAMERAARPGRAWAAPRPVARGRGLGPGARRPGPAGTGAGPMAGPQIDGRHPWRHCGGPASSRARCCARRQRLARASVLSPGASVLCHRRLRSDRRAAVAERRGGRPRVWHGQYRLAHPVPGVASADLERARSLCRGPAPGGGGAPPRHQGRPRGHIYRRSRLARPPVPRPRGPGARYPGVGAGPDPLSCLRPWWLAATDLGGPGLCRCTPGVPRGGVRAARGSEQRKSPHGRAARSGLPGRMAQRGYRLAGRGEEAWQYAHQALDLARQQKARWEEVLALRQLGTVHAHADLPDVEQAEAYYQQAQALANELGTRPLVAHCHRGLGMLYAAIGQREQARTALSAALDLYRTMDMTFWLPQTEAALAQVEGQ